MSPGGVVLGVVDTWEPVPDRVSEGVRGRRRVGRRADEGVLVADCGSVGMSMILHIRVVRRGGTMTFASARPERIEGE